MEKVINDKNSKMINTLIESNGSLELDLTSEEAGELGIENLELYDLITLRMDKKTNKVKYKGAYLVEGNYYSDKASN